VDRKDPIHARQQGGRQRASNGAKSSRPRTATNEREAEKGKICTAAAYEREPIEDTRINEGTKEEREKQAGE